MYLRYLKNIHNVNNFYSILRGKDDNCINLMKHDGNYISLGFKTSTARDFILNQIWKEIEKGTICYDIDSVIESIYASEIYNL